MEDKNGMKKALALMQTGFHDQLSALKSDAKGARNDVETMLNLSATLEAKTTSQEESLDAALNILKEHTFLIYKTRETTILNAVALLVNMSIHCFLAMVNENKRGDWIELLWDVQENFLKTSVGVMHAKNTSSLKEITFGFYDKIDNILKRSTELVGEY